MCTFIVCSTTIWIGHLNKSTSQDDINEEMVKHGDVLSINVSFQRFKALHISKYGGVPLTVILSFVNTVSFITD